MQPKRSRSTATLQRMPGHHGRRRGYVTGNDHCSHAFPRFLDPKLGALPKVSRELPTVRDCEKGLSPPTCCDQRGATRDRSTALTEPTHDRDLGCHTRRGGTSFGLTPVALLSHGGLTQHTELKIIPSHEASFMRHDPRESHSVAIRSNGQTQPSDVA